MASDYPLCLDNGRGPELPVVPGVGGDLPLIEFSSYNAISRGMDSSLANCLPSKAPQVLSSVISDRISFLEESTEQMKAQIQERQELKNSLDAEIDQRLCQVQTMLHQLKPWDGISKPEGRRVTSLEKQIGELYKEKREHRLSHWQDTVMLKRELRKAQKELRTAMLDMWMTRFLS